VLENQQRSRPLRSMLTRGSRRIIRAVRRLTSPAEQLFAVQIVP
jgi:hypothetical protein